MIQIQGFTFNPFSENTYVLYDETGECVIFDPGCYTAEERHMLSGFIAEKGLKPVLLVNTHAHLDHVCGNNYVVAKYGVGLVLHKLELPVLESAERVAMQYGFRIERSPEPDRFIDENDTIKFGNSELKILFTPGHSPGSLTFYSESQKFALAGDVLFRESIGRTDLPGGDFDTLISSIRNKLFVLDDGFRIYSGHGEPTTIGHEKRFNPFLS